MKLKFKLACLLAAPLLLAGQAHANPLVKRGTKVLQTGTKAAPLATRGYKSARTTGRTGSFARAASPQTTLPGRFSRATTPTHAVPTNLRLPVKKSAPAKAFQGLQGRGVKPKPGTRVIPEGVPGNWRIRNANRPDTVVIYDPVPKKLKGSNAGKPTKDTQIRIAQGTPGHPHANSRNPYVIQQRNGQRLDASGNVVSKNTADAHIPLKDYKFRTELFQ